LMKSLAGSLESDTVVSANHLLNCADQGELFLLEL
jgi:hypothetical protein